MLQLKKTGGSTVAGSSKLNLWLAGWLSILLLALVLIAPTTGQANGGTVIFNGDTGPFNVYLVISPSPPTPNVPAHLTMQITRAGSDQKVTGASVFLEPSMPGMEMPGLTGQRFIQNPANPNQYDIDVPLTMEGLWRFKITIVDPQLGQTSFQADARVEKPDAPWPIIIAILVALPTLAALTWWFLFRKQDEDDEDDEDEDDSEDQSARKVKVGP